MRAETMSRFEHAIAKLRTLFREAISQKFILAGYMSVFGNHMVLFLHTMLMSEYHVDVPNF